MKTNIRRIAAILAFVIAIAMTFTACSNISFTSGENNPPETTNSAANPSAPSSDLDPALTYYADIAIEGHGTITVELDQKAAPVTAANFVKLAKSGFYDGLTFHRIIEGFMMQGGCPKGNGFGGSDETIVGEFAENGYNNPLSHTRGAISMARSNAYNSASSQFFIVHTDNFVNSLDGRYAAFGYVIEGIEIVDAICEAAEPIDNNGFIDPAEQPVITAITIRTTSK